MELINIRPEDIEKKSFSMITEELENMGKTIDEVNAPIIKRCIHTTADFDYADTLRFSKDAKEVLKELIKNGADIVTDTNMGLSGINKKEFSKYGGNISCFMADEEVAKKAKELGTTRASVSMAKAMESGRETIFVIGNAPTALITLHDAYKENGYMPAFIVGVPVGFVNVEAAKELIINSDIPHIVNEGRKGGSNVAACIINAVLYELREGR
jgi:precorrin-8X/cobalt-precorrin-8 methylmutase